MINFGTGLICVEVTWQQLRSLLTTKKMQLQYEETSDVYTLFALDERIVYVNTIFKGTVPTASDTTQGQNDSDKSEFELFYKPISNRSSRVDAKVVNVNLALTLTGTFYGFGTQEDDNFIDWVLASSSFPIFLTPIQIGESLWSDGGIKSTTPLGRAIKSGADEIDVILCYDPEAKTVWDSSSKCAVPDQLIRTLELMSDQIAVSDLKIAGLKNDLVEPGSKYSKVRINVYCPTGALPVKNSLEFDHEQIVKMIDLGYLGHQLYKIIE